MPIFTLFTFSGKFGKNMRNRHCSRQDGLWEGWSKSSSYGIKFTVRVYQMLFENLKLKWKLNSWPFYIKWNSLSCQRENCAALGFASFFISCSYMNYTCTYMYVLEFKWKICKLVGSNLNSSFSLVKIFTQQIKPLLSDPSPIIGYACHSLTP